MEQPQLNRKQRKIEEKMKADKRYHKMTPKQKKLYSDRARMWSKGCVVTGRHIGGEFETEWAFPAVLPKPKHAAVMDYATHAPMRWKITACVVLRYEKGDERRFIEAECSQVQKIAELHDLREQLMRDLKATVNSRYVWDEYFKMECLG